MTTILIGKVCAGSASIYSIINTATATEKQMSSTQPSIDVIDNIASKCHAIHETLLALEIESLWLPWPQILAKLNVLMTQWGHLQNTIKTDLDKWIISPNLGVTESLHDSQFANLPPHILLRTKLAPELEEQEASISNLRHLHEQAKKEHVDWIQKFITERIIPWNNSVQDMLNQLENAPEGSTSKTGVVQETQTKDSFSLEELIKWQFV